MLWGSATLGSEKGRSTLVSGNLARRCLSWGLSHSGSEKGRSTFVSENLAHCCLSSAVAATSEKGCMLVSVPLMLSGCLPPALATVLPLPLPHLQLYFLHILFCLSQRSVCTCLLSLYIYQLIGFQHSKHFHQPSSVCLRSAHYFPQRCVYPL